MTDGDDITLVCLNIGRGGGKLDLHAAVPPEVGNDPDRWANHIVPRLRTVRWPDGATHTPAVIALNELSGWDMPRLKAAAADFGMRVAGLTPRPPGDLAWPAYRSGMLYDPAQIGPLERWNTNHSYASHHGLGVAKFNPAGLGRPLGIVVTHLTPFSPVAAEAEAGLVNYRTIRFGPYGIALGDFNYLPLIGATYDPSDFGPHNWASRFHLPDAWFDEPVTEEERQARAEAIALDPPRPRFEIARMLRAGDLHDAAALMYRRTGDKRHLRWTCPSMRIDWGMLTGALVPSLVDYQVLDRKQPGDLAASWVADHHAVALRLNFTKASVSSFQYH